MGGMGEEAREEGRGGREHDFRMARGQSRQRTPVRTIMGRTAGMPESPSVTVCKYGRRFVRDGCWFLHPHGGLVDGEGRGGNGRDGGGGRSDDSRGRSGSVHRAERLGRGKDWAFPQRSGSGLGVGQGGHRQRRRSRGRSRSATRSDSGSLGRRGTGGVGGSGMGPLALGGPVALGGIGQTATAARHRARGEARRMKGSGSFSLVLRPPLGAPHHDQLRRRHRGNPAAVG